MLEKSPKQVGLKSVVSPAWLEGARGGVAQSHTTAPHQGGTMCQKEVDVAVLVKKRVAGDVTDNEAMKH